MKLAIAFPLSLLVTTALLAPGCGSSSSTASDGTESEVAVSAIGGTSTASEGSVAMNDPAIGKPKLRALVRALSPVSTAWAVPACDFANLVTTCSSNVESITFNGCSVSDPAIKIRGSESLTWTGAGCCTATPLTASSATPCAFTRRTINTAGTSDPLVRSVGANEVTLNTEDSSGYATAKTGGFTVACQGSGGTQTCDAQRQITISGAHYTGQTGRATLDHTVSTDVPVVVQGHDSGRKVLSGTVRVQNNSAQFTAVSTIATTLTYSANCCFPTGGSVSTAFTGGKLDGKTETMTFGPTCGAATLSNAAQQATGLTLHHCL